jgi:GH35 family endo-1,4-beta-xylanase
MGQKKIRVISKDGTALAGKPVKVEMQRHEFLFGAGVFGTPTFDVVSYASGEMKDSANREAFEQRFEKWEALMNNATLPFYWGGFEPEEGKPRNVQVMAGAKFLKERGITLKGHPLCWHTGCANWLLKYSNAEIIRKQIERIKRDVSYHAGVIDMWDVINEVVIMPVFDKYDNAITRICKELGRVKTVKTMFDTARETNPEGKFLINDFNLSQSYQILIDGCLNSGVPIDAIGLQTHMHQGYMGGDRLEEVLARYEVFGLPLHFTEITLISGAIMPPEIVDLNDFKNDDWATTPEFEDRQAREFVEMYEILFSHPLVSTAYSWEFVDGGWLNAPAGLLRKDGSAKPAYDALYELIRKRWWTNTEVITDENGEAVIEGFRGDYKLTCLNATTEIALRKGQRVWTADVPKPDSIHTFVV